MIHIGDDNVLVIDSYNIDKLENYYLINLNSASTIMLLEEPNDGNLELILNDKICCSLPASIHDELIHKLNISGLFRDKYINYISNAFYLKEESKSKDKSQITKDDFEPKPSFVDLFVKTDSPDIISIIDIPSFKNENNEIIPGKIIVETTNRGKIVIYKEEE